MGFQAAEGVNALFGEWAQNSPWAQAQQAAFVIE